MSQPRPRFVGCLLRNAKVYRLNFRDSITKFIIFRRFPYLSQIGCGGVAIPDSPRQDRIRERPFQMTELNTAFDALGFLAGQD